MFFLYLLSSFEAFLAIDDLLRYFILLSKMYTLRAETDDLLNRTGFLLIL